MATQKDKYVQNRIVRMARIAPNLIRQIKNKSKYQIPSSYLKLEKN